MLKRSCPKCEVEICYTNKYNGANAEKKKSLCSSCRLDWKRLYTSAFVLGGKWNRACPKCKKNIAYSSKYHADRADVTDSLCRSCSHTGFKQSEATKQKRRERKAKMYGGISYNPVACRLFDRLEEEFGWDGQHAEKVGEKMIVGYLVDYYEPTLNLVIEYDEKHHQNTSRKKKDAARAQRIIEASNCNFSRICYSDSWRTIVEKYLAGTFDNVGTGYRPRDRERKGS